MHSEKEIETETIGDNEEMNQDVATKLMEDISKTNAVQDTVLAESAKSLPAISIEGVVEGHAEPNRKAVNATEIIHAVTGDDKEAGGKDDVKSHEKNGDKEESIDSYADGVATGGKDERISGVAEIPANNRNQETRDDKDDKTSNNRSREAIARMTDEQLLDKLRSRLRMDLSDFNNSPAAIRDQNLSIDRELGQLNRQQLEERLHGLSSAERSEESSNVSASSTDKWVNRMVDLGNKLNNTWNKNR